MADLYNLLDGLDETQQDDTQYEEEAKNDPDLDQDSQIRNLNNDDEDREVTTDPVEQVSVHKVPLALQEAERRKLQGVTPDDLEISQDNTNVDNSPYGPFGTEKENGLDGLVLPKEFGCSSSSSPSSAGLLTAPYEKLKSLWQQELNSPELLPYEEELLDNLIEAMEAQEDRIDEYVSNHTGNTNDANRKDIFASLWRIDLDRVKYLVSDLLRQRLHKIEAHPFYMRDHCMDSMSQNETLFQKNYQKLVENHQGRAVLDHFPQDVWKTLDTPDMIDSPDFDTHVFIRTMDEIEINIGTEERPEMELRDAGKCMIVRYQRIRKDLLEGKVELLM